jgi:23S rRNA (uracil1939-C5)-methyltransferase
MRPAAVAACPHRPPCPGCPRFGETGIPDDARAALAALLADASLPPPVVVEGASLGYRHRARLAVRGRAASPKIGIFQERSHRVVDIPRCLVHHPVVNEVAAVTRESVRRIGVVPYADRPHRGTLRYLQVVVERRTARAQVVLVGNDNVPDALEPVARAIERGLGSRLHSLWWNGNPARTNTILGPSWHRWAGADAVREELGGAEVFFPPGAFGQSNLPLFEEIVAQVARWVPDGARLLEFHAGCGAVGLGLLPRVASAAFNEIASSALDGLAMGLAGRPPDERARAVVLPGEARDHVAAVREADVVIIDPPRRGLDDALLAALVADPPARLIAISCSLDTFVRDTRALLASGRVRLRTAVPYALFPHTAHVETLARFDRV